MKKFYTLAALAFAAMGANADVVLTIDGNVIDPAETATIYAQVYNDGTAEEPEVSIFCGMDNPTLLNQGTVKADYSVTVEVENPDEFQWCFPMSCDPLEGKVTTKSHSLDAGARHPFLLEPHVAGEGEYGPDFYCTHNVKVTIKEGSKSTVYNLSYVYDASCDEKAGLNSIANITTGSKTSTIYDLTGRIVTNPVAGQLYIQSGRKVIR